MFESPNADATLASSQTSTLADLPFDTRDELLDVLENAPIGIHFVDEAGTILWANKAQILMLGYDASEYIGKNARLFHADKDLVERIFEKLRAGDSVENCEFSLIRKDGSLTTVSLNSNVRRDGGQFVHSRCFFRDITEQKLEGDRFRQQALADSRKLRLYEAILSRISDFNQAYDHDGRIIYVNQSLLDLWGGVKLEDVVGKNFFDLNYPAELAERLESQIKSVFETGIGLKDQTPYTSPTGVDGVYEYIFQPVLDESGRVEMVTGSTRDISELSHTIADMRQAQELLRLAMVSSRMGAWTRDLATDAVEWTPEFGAIFGLKPEAFKGNKDGFLEKVVADDRKKVVDEIQRAIETRSEYITRFRFVHADGSIRWMEGRGRAFYDADGVPRKLFGIGIDITEREAASEAQLEYERSLEEMANAFPQLAWMADRDGYIFWYNQQWYQYTGTTLEEMEGWGWQSVHDPEMLGEVVKNWKDSILKGQEFEMEFPLRRGDGKFEWFLTRATPFRDANGNLTRWFGTNTNIEELWNIRRRSEEANRAKDEFLAVLSHELRAPLNLMSGWVQILRDNDSNEDTVRSGIDVIAKSIETQEALIEDLLDVSRIVSGKVDLDFSDLDFGSLVTSVLDGLENEASSKDIQLKRSIARVGLIGGDGRRLTQVVSNILNNALKFSSPGGVVTTSLSQLDGNVRLSVKDEGVGISEEVLPFIFERFRQADSTSKRTYGGLGLGLAIVERLVTLHKGTVRAHSEGPGRGTEIIVEFPVKGVSGATVQAPTKKIADDSGAKLSNLRILVVDDDPDALELMHMFLKIQGAYVTKAKGAGEALELLGADHFDLLISDLGMPEMDGFDLIRSIRTSMPPDQLPAIALTGFASESDKTRVRSAGFQAHLPKPIEFSDLVQKIADISNENGSV